MKNNVKMENWLLHEQNILPIIQTFYETEKIDFLNKSKIMDAIVFYKGKTIDLFISKEYCKGEQFIAKNKELQIELDCIIKLGFRYHSWLEIEYKKNPQLSMRF